MFKVIKPLAGLCLVQALLVTQPVAADDKQLQSTLNTILQELRSLKGRVDRLESSGAKGGDVAAAQRDLDALTSATEQANSTIEVARPAKENVGGPYQNNFLANTTVGGYASTEFENFENNDSTFDQHRFIVNVGSRINERLKFYSEVELEHGASIESEGSASGEVSIEDTNGNGVIDAGEASDIPVDLDAEVGRSGEIAVEQAWMQYDFNKNVGLRGGIVLAPFGKYNLTHDDDLHLLTDRPLVARRVIPTTWAEAGLGVVTDHEVAGDARVRSEVYVINGLNDEFSSGSGALRDAKGDFEQDNNNNKAVVGRVALSPSIDHEFGLSGYTGAYDEEGNDINAGAFDWDMRFGAFRFIGESAIFAVEQGLNSSGAPAPKQLWGAYGELNYDFWFDALNETFLGDGFADPKFTAVFRYNYAEIERRVALSTLDQNSYVFGVAYRPVTNFLFKTEYQLNDGELERGDNDGFLASIAVGF